MFVNTQMGGLNFAFPDVCLTPTPAGIVPIPYPNIDFGMAANPATASLKVLLNGAPAHHMNTVGTISNGDNAGVKMGVVCWFLIYLASNLLFFPDYLDLSV